MADQPKTVTVDIPGVGFIKFPADLPPDQINAAAKRLYDQAHPPAAPPPKSPSEQFWSDHPNAKQLARGTLNMFPAIGGTIGALAGSELGPAGNWGGGVLGTMAGRALRDPVAQYTGLDEPSQTPLLDTVARMGVDGAIAGATPFVLQRLKDMATAPKESAADVLETLAHPKDSIDKTIQFLRGEPIGPSAPVTEGGTPPAVRIGGKAPSLEEALTQALNEVRQGPAPTSVSLPGGGATRLPSEIPAVSGPNRLGAYSSMTPTQAEANAGGVRLRTPPRLVLTPEEINAADQLKHALKPKASLEGMKSAARVKLRDLPNPEDALAALRNTVH